MGSIPTPATRLLGLTVPAAAIGAAAGAALAVLALLANPAKSAELCKTVSAFALRPGFDCVCDPNLQALVCRPGAYPSPAEDSGVVAGDIEPAAGDPPPESIGYPKTLKERLERKCDLACMRLAYEGMLESARIMSTLPVLP